MADTTSIQRTPVGDLRTALHLAQSWTPHGMAGKDFQKIARLLCRVIEQLGEPSLACVQATATLMREFNGNVTVSSRYFRDSAAVILNAQMTGEIPPTWSES